MNWWLSVEIGVGILFGTLFTRIFDWLVGSVRGGRASGDGEAKP